MASRTSLRLRRMIYQLIDLVSFNGKIRDLSRMLNKQVEHPDEPPLDMLSHPGGFIRAFHKRRMGMAESYVHIARTLDREYGSKRRLHALKKLADLSLHAKTVSMPLNTARVQIEIMKQAVKNSDNPRKQMEMIADFTLASYGHESVIHRFLRELKRVETPENGLPLKDLDLGWDSHVHDNVSEGRKTPSQLILDAFIKGMSRLTLAYYDIPSTDILNEGAEAGRILGIDVSVGIEFSVGMQGARRHFMYLPPVDEMDSIADFFKEKGPEIAEFVEGLEENRKRRRQTITAILKNFNSTHLIWLNQGYPDNSALAFKPVCFEDIEKIVPHRQYSRNHLSELLFSKYKDVLKKRVLSLKVQYEISSQLYKKKKISDWELERIKDKFFFTQKQYRSLSPTTLNTEYFTGKYLFDYDSVFEQEADIFSCLKKAGGRIVYNRPLEQGPGRAIATIIDNHRFIDCIELMNMRDSEVRNPSEIIQQARFIDLVNNHDLKELQNFFHELQMDWVDDDLVVKTHEHYQKNPLIPFAGSASAGWKPRVPGMGFIKKSSILSKSVKHFEKNHYHLPQPVAGLICCKGRRQTKKSGTGDEILALGKSSRFKPNLIGDEESVERIGPARMWRYLNPGIKNLIRVITGFLPALLWIGPAYACIWFSITFLRNVFTDLFALTGTRFRQWSLKNVNFDNATQSLLWTGFSVPVLTMVKIGFDHAWQGENQGPLFEWSKFFTICIANGIYISCHNRLRQFDSTVIRANFFRSIFAWPFAALFSPVGNFLGIPSIVQAKFWSDGVGAVIEGAAKFKQKIVIRKRDYIELIPKIRSDERAVRIIAMLDILYIWAKRLRGRTCLARILLEKKSRRNIFSKASGKKKAENGSEQKPDQIDIALLCQLYKPGRAQIELGMFIIEHYTDQEAVVMTGLLNKYLVPFHEWLKKIKKQTQT
ncbi:hypothetical protein QUF76_05740 [Desulfobacterales bacterium HSG16]|nr:hypothetical protein [Desulfobacterales bacterium HSG16]